ncbi:MAG: malate/lactate/ureidoglycolate dehydrogenase [Geminicoccaceae bacterium]|nr:malate/lactate/ureidoglycolate dehydrogenase [Geminicoccaceae bacterium]
MTMRRIPAEALEAMARATLKALGSNDDEADAVAAHLVGANLAGHDSHGVGMLPDYVRLVRDGLAVPNQELAVLADLPGLVHCDAKRGLGQRMARDALHLGAARAREAGACVVALKNSSHVGRIGHYVEALAAEGFASVHFVNVADHRALQAPYACGDARLGTNPFAAGLPAEGAPVVLDMATSAIAYGKARVARNRGDAVPEGALIDAAGRPTRDPVPLVDLQEGAIRAFGGHKGSGLAIVCELLGAALTGGLTLQPDHPRQGGIVNSMLSVVIRAAALGDPAALGHEAAAVRSWIKASPPAAGFDEVLVPGEPEARVRAERRRDGVPLDPKSLADILDAARDAGADGESLRALTES